jgi:hypothetical protein
MGMTFDPKASPEQRTAAVQGLIAELNADRAPILCGPWRSEVGFEVSYWEPFLRFLSTKVADFDKRAAIITRGGLAPLYAHCASQGYDLYALRSVEDVRRENLYDAKFRQDGKTIKQLVQTEWDADVLADAADALSLGSVYHSVHPAWCYWALAPYWEDAAGMAYLSTLTTYQTLPKIGLQSDLPPQYVAMKWYGRATFPYPHAEVAEFVKHTVAVVAQQCPVVLLNAGSQHDDHVDIPVVGTNVHLLPDVKPEDNLKVQAAVIGQAKAFIGTYGGVAQLALRLGIPSVSFYSEWHGTSHQHYSLSSWLSKASKVPFLVGSLTDAAIWKQVLVVPQAVAA